MSQMHMIIVHVCLFYFVPNHRIITNTNQIELFIYSRLNLLLIRRYESAERGIGDCSGNRNDAGISARRIKEGPNRYDAKFSHTHNHAHTKLYNGKYLMITLLAIQLFPLLALHYFLPILRK